MCLIEGVITFTSNWSDGWNFFFQWNRIKGAHNQIDLIPVLVENFFFYMDEVWGDYK